MNNEYQKMNEQIGKDLLFILAYTRGCQVELGMSIENSIKEAYRIRFKMNKGFVEPYKFNITKYERLVEQDHSELDYLKIKFTGEEIQTNDGVFYPFKIED